MPFDSTPLEAKPDLTVPSAEALVWLLRHRDHWPVRFRSWDFSACERCAIGLARHQWGTRYSIFPHIVGEAAVSAVANGAYTPLQDRDVTPEMVADRIEACLARRG